MGAYRCPPEGRFASEPKNGLYSGNPGKSVETQGGNNPGRARVLTGKTIEILLFSASCFLLVVFRTKIQACVLVLWTSDIINLKPT